MKHSSGFTLIELSFTLAISAILFASSLEYFKDAFSTAEIQREVKRIESTLNEARVMARDQLRCVEMNITVNQIQITPYLGCTGVFTSPQTPTVINFPASISLNSATGAIIPILKDGRLNMGQSAIIQVSSSGNPIRTFEMLPRLGAIR